MIEPHWSLHADALAQADKLYQTQLSPISFAAFASGMLTEPGGTPFIGDRTGREVYADALLDLSRLLEEVRFEVSLAVMLLVDFTIRNPNGSEPKRFYTPDGREMTLSVELLAVLSQYGSDMPPPSFLTHSLHREIGGQRHLSRWLAGQLLDGAMLRALSCLDRIATMLHLRAGLTLDFRSDGTARLPSFDKGDLRRLRAAFADRPGWPQFWGLTNDEMFKFAKRFRNGTVHHRRWPSALHGEVTLSYWDAAAPFDPYQLPEERRYEGLSAQEHVGLLLATWDRLLRSAIQSGGELLIASTGSQTPAEEPGADS